MTIQDSMFSDIRNKALFEKAHSHATTYIDNAFERNVFPTEQALQDLSCFDECIPEHSGNAEQILDQLHRFGSPATVSQIGGRYYGLVSGGIVPAALAAKVLSNSWDQNTPLWATSPIVSKLEGVVEGWLIDLFELPVGSVAGFVSGTSMAIMCGLAAARWRVCERQGYDVNAKGLSNGPPIRLVTGRETHGTVLKAIALLGLGSDTIEWVDCDAQGRLNPTLIPALDDSTILILQAGNVNSGSFDDFQTLCSAAKAANAWVHIDGAFGLWAAASEDLKYLTRGAGLANSWSVDGHKTLNTPYDCGVALCSDREALVSALQATGAYMFYSENRDGMLYTPEMSRRARVVEIWAAMKYLGRQGMDQMVHGLHVRAVQFAKELSELEGFQVLNDVVFNQVVACCESDELTEQVIPAIQDLRECWVGGSYWQGRQVIRISVCSWATTESDVTRSVHSFKTAFASILKER